MDQLVKFVNAYKLPIMLGLGILMLVVWVFCPVIDVLGKLEANGIQSSFGGKGLGFCRFCSFACLLLPVAYIAAQFVKAAADYHLRSICMLGMFVFSVLFAVSLPQGCSLSYGAGVYICLSILGIAVHILGNLSINSDTNQPTTTDVAE